MELHRLEIGRILEEGKNFENSHDRSSMVRNLTYHRGPVPPRSRTSISLAWSADRTSRPSPARLSQRASSELWVLATFTEFFEK